MSSQHSSTAAIQKMHIVVIGSGGGAMGCALKATELGASVTVIEHGVMGGTCVNIGCVPSKIMVRAGYIAKLRRQSPFDAGISNNPDVAIDRATLQSKQQATVDHLREMKYEQILDSNPDIRVLKGTASFVDQNHVLVNLNDGGEQLVSFDKCLIATGASAYIPPIKGLSDTPYWTSTDAVMSKAIPKRLAVIGSSVIAVELAQVYARLGSEVVMLARQRLLSTGDTDISASLTQIFRDEGIDVRESTQVSAVDYQDGRFTLHTVQGDITVDQLLVATGRKANTALLNLDLAGIETNPDGSILANDLLQTSLPNVYAVGDCTTQPQFVYVAAAAGKAAAVNMLGGNSKPDFSVLPEVIFTDPQVASVGLTEAEARQQGIVIDSRTLDVAMIPKAIANGTTQGLIKLLQDSHTGKLIGAHIVSAEAGEMIQTAALAVKMGMTTDQLAEFIFPYLTMVEGLKLAAQTFRQDVKQLSCCAG